jgi:hypothetical protein
MKLRGMIGLIISASIGLAVAAFVIARENNAPDRPSLAELAVNNYKTLSPAKSRELVRYAHREYACLRGHGVRIGRPIATRTRITMRAAGQKVNDLVDAMMMCNPTVGEPPSEASLQARNGLVLVYLPKRCLLDPSQLTET